MKKGNFEKNRFAAKDIALMGVMIATLVAVKQALSFLPNIELVTLLIILYSLFFGNKIWYVILAFILLEGCWYGFGTWWFMYAYIWPALALLTRVFRKIDSLWFWSAFSGLFGLFFGALCSLTYLFFGGPRTAAAWWIAGIPYDIIHCISNAVLCLILFRPLQNIFKRLGSSAV